MSFMTMVSFYSLPNEENDTIVMNFPVAQLVKNPSAIQETWVLSLSWEDLLEEGMATHSNILTWRILWTV